MVSEVFVPATQDHVDEGRGLRHDSQDYHTAEDTLSSCEIVVVIYGMS